MPNTLFVVDDSATMRKVFELTFAGEDFTVVTHDGGDGVVAKIREVRPQAAIVDVNLGGSAGYDLVRSIRSDAGLGPIPIYLLYSEHSPLDEPAARSCGAVGAIVKPFETQVIIDKVKQAFSATAKAAASVTATTGNMTAPFGNPQPAPATVGAVPPPPARGAEPAFTAPRPGGVVTGGRPVTGATPIARGAAPPPAAPPGSSAAPGAPGAANLRPPPLPGGGRPVVPTPPGAATAVSHPIRPVEKPAERPVEKPVERAPEKPAPQVAIAEDEVRFETPSEAPKAAAKPAATVHDKPAPTIHEKATAPVLAPATDAAVLAAARAVEQQVSGLGLTPAQVEAVTALTRDVVERVVWEVVPQLAEAMIREELKRLTAD